MYAAAYKPAVENINKILNILNREYPEAVSTSLKHKNAFQLLISTILSAQSTDKLVNKVTPALFKKYKNPEDFARANIIQLQEDIKSTGFYRNKAKNIINCSKDIITRFKGAMPDNIEDLTLLHGVGRKTANVVLANVFGRQAIIVDTHVKRISYRLGLTINADPVKIEFDLMEIIPKERWSSYSHMIIEHGRTICLARSPKCHVCRLLKYCRYGQENA
ncbi:MAG: endonuclease III [Actinobacteria bacterium RBG_19FT_COMBO_36_27]|nr:MAG: endonuclease III [Actinobacteria bacterium RBG_19FT_COMBO_36_27]